MEEQYSCSESCKYQREGKCILDRSDFLAPIHGAVCAEHLWEDEGTLHH